MKKLFATVSAVVLSLAMVALPSVAASADDTESTDIVTTETTEATPTESTETTPAPEAAPTESTTTTDSEAAPAETTEPETAPVEPAPTETESTETESTQTESTEPESTETESTETYVASTQRGETYVLTDSPVVMVDVCHWDQSEKWTPITISSAALGASGHNDPSDNDDHYFDIVEPFLDSPGKNYSATSVNVDEYKDDYPFNGWSGAAIMAAGCEEPDEEAIEVTPDATFVDESCDVESQVLTAGVITVDLTVEGVTYSITQGGNPVAFDAVTGETGPLTAGLTYIVTATADTGYTLSGPYEEQFTPFSAAVDCETLPLVVPQASQEPGCELPSSYTIGNDLSDPAALSWTANGNPIAEGTHAVNSPTTITLVATANGPEYGIADGIQREWTFSFPEDETCDLATLALTGASDTTPALALTAFLGLLGLAMVRSGIRVNRTRQEA